MAGIDIGGFAKREVNREVVLIPFIDFLLCLVSFLLITAVWSQNGRLEATARVPGGEEPKPAEEPKLLHVDVRDRKFELAWKRGATVLAQQTVERKPVVVEGGETRYPELAETIRQQWEQAGAHRSASDPERDRVVLHSTNDLEFGELAAVLDAIHATRRERRVGGDAQTIPAFSVSFAVN